MSDTSKQPAFRLMAAPVTGYGQGGRPILGSFSEIGAIWPAKEGKKWLPCNFNIVPAGLDGEAVRLFLAPVGDGEISVTGDLTKPLHRIMAAQVQQGSFNRQSLGAFCAIGATWAPKDGGKWAPFNLALVPMGLEQGRVKLFLADYEEAGAQPGDLAA